MGTTIGRSEIEETLDSIAHQMQALEVLILRQISNAQQDWSYREEYRKTARMLEQNATALRLQSLSLSKVERTHD